MSLFLLFFISFFFFFLFASGHDFPVCMISCTPKTRCGSSVIGSRVSQFACSKCPQQLCRQSALPTYLPRISASKVSLDAGAEAPGAQGIDRGIFWPC